MLKLIVAMDANRGIGLNEKMPWHLPEEMKIFRTLTSGHSVLFGRKTFLGMGGMLKNRKHYVSTKQSDFKVDGVEVVHNLIAFFKKHEKSDELIYVSGGASIYQQSFPYIQEAYISVLKESYHCDTFFPDFDLTQFELISKTNYDSFIHYHYRRKN